VLLQYPDDLFFGVAGFLHRPSPSGNGLYLKARALSGVTSRAMVIAHSKPAGAPERKETRPSRLTIILRPLNGFADPGPQNAKLG
jgi:hypothetical protein